MRKYLSEKKMAEIKERLFEKGVYKVRDAQRPICCHIREVDEEKDICFNQEEHDEFLRSLDKDMSSEEIEMIKAEILKSENQNDGIDWKDMTTI